MFRHSMGAILRECLQSHTGTRINILVLVLVLVCDCPAYGPLRKHYKNYREDSPDDGTHMMSINM